MGELLAALSEHFKQVSVRQFIRLKPSDGRLRALLFKRGVIHQERHTDDGGWELDVELSRRDFDQLLSHEPNLKDAVVN